MVYSGNKTLSRLCVNPPLSMGYFCNKIIFYIEEMRCYFIMGRGRKGLIEQSERKKKASGAYRETFTYLTVPNREIKKNIGT